MKKRKFNHGPPWTETALEIFKFALLPGLILAMLIAWRVYDASAGGADDKAGMKALNFFTALAGGLTLLLAAVPTWVNLSLREGIVIDPTSRTVVKWKGGVGIHRKSERVPFDDIRHVSIEQHHITLPGIFVSSVRVCLVLNWETKIDLTSSRSLAEARAAARDAANAMGVPVEEEPGIADGRVEKL